jgi:hypothetical protein
MGEPVVKEFGNNSTYQTLLSQGLSGSLLLELSKASILKR